MSAGVFIIQHEWDRHGHGGIRQEATYEVFLGAVMLRRFSTHGDMTEGYWGNKARPAAEEYAGKVAHELGCSVIWGTKR